MDLYNNSYLYIHTSYPDKGWDIAHLLKNAGISNKVLCTYVCQSCKHSFISFFGDARSVCPHCNAMAAVLPSTVIGVEETELVNIYNLFDAYVQYSNCLAPQQPILTKTGWKNIEDIQIGEYVYTHNGKYQKVLQTFTRQHNKDINQIKICGSSDTLRLTDEHPVYIIDKNKIGYINQKNSLREFIGTKIKLYNIEIPLCFTETNNLQVGDMIAEKIDMVEQDVYSIDLAFFAQQNLQTEQYVYDDSRISLRRSDIYPRFIKTDNDFCRFLGLYLADGTCVKSGISICNHINELTNIELATRILTLITNKQPTIRKYKNAHAIDIIGNSLLLRLLFKQYNKLENKHFPSWVLTLPIEKQKHIVHGMFMGDSHYSTDRNVSIYVTISYVLSQQLKHMLKRIGLTYNLRKIIRDGNRKPQYRFELRGNIKNGDFDTARQNTSSLNYNGFYFTQIKQINKLPYNGYVYNIEVEEDNSYTTTIGSVHNCEGFGLPVMEAAACGVPVFATDYSALEDVVRKVNGFPLKVQRMFYDIETESTRALPDNQDAAQQLYEFMSLPDSLKNIHGIKARNGVKKYYTWNNTANKWMHYLDNLELKDLQGKWNIPYTPHEIPSQIPNKLDNEEFIDWLITKVLDKSDKIGSYSALKMLSSLNFEAQIIGQKQIRLTRDEMFNKCVKIAQDSHITHSIRSGQIPLPNEDFLEYAEIKAKQ